jgi:predicted nuclease with RNAse H fold
MLSIGRRGPSAVAHYCAQVAGGAEGYYLGSGEEPDEWVGAAAGDLGLSGALTRPPWPGSSTGATPPPGAHLMPGGPRSRRQQIDLSLCVEPNRIAQRPIDLCHVDGTAVRWGPNRRPEGDLLTQYILGTDPGGKKGNGQFGWALVKYVPGEPPPQHLTATYSDVGHDANEVWTRANEALGASDQIVAMGVDAPLGYDETGDRRIDPYIREVLRADGSRSGPTPCAVNSLRGACLAQGVVISLIAQAAGVRIISESYPRAVRDLRSGSTAQCRSCSVPTLLCHQCDATLSSLSAWAYLVNMATGTNPKGWENWHTLHGGLRPKFMVVADHEYWLPVVEPTSTS